jgi:hypothetical protein
MCNFKDISENKKPYINMQLRFKNLSNFQIHINPNSFYKPQILTILFNTSATACPPAQLLKLAADLIVTTTIYYISSIQIAPEYFFSKLMSKV